MSIEENKAILYRWLGWVCDEIGADGFTEDCASAVDEATRLIALVGRV